MKQRKQPHLTGWRRSAALIALASATACVTPTGAAPTWPTSADFPRDSTIPSQLVGATYNGWVDQGGGWITDAGPGWDELWQLVFAREDKAAIVIVTPEAYDSEGSVETWRVRTSLLMDRNTELPMDWLSCRQVDDTIRPVYARWQPGGEPTDIWAFSPQQGQFESLIPQRVACVANEPE